MKTLLICAITDEKYPFALATMFVNVLEKCPNTFIKFYCLVTGSLPQEDRLKILSIKDIYPNCSITLIDLGNKYMDLNCTHKYVTKACWYKFSILEEVQEDKILYLDTDVLVKRDLTELFETDMQDNYLAGAISHIENERMKKKLSEKGFIINDYINAGVMLMNLKQMRQDNILEKLETLMKDFPDTVDQDIFNIVCTNKIYYFDEKYNYLFRYSNFYNAKNEKDLKVKRKLQSIDVHILHYAGYEKPWLFYGMTGDNLWNLYYKKTPYKVTKLVRKCYYVSFFAERTKLFIRKQRNRIKKIVKILKGIKE